jgi:hypothetical protein
MWTGIGVGLLGVSVLGLIAMVVWAAQSQNPNLWLEHPFQSAVAVLVLITLAGAYALLGPFVGLPLPPTRSEPFWSSWNLRLQSPIAVGPAPNKQAALSPRQLAEQVTQRRADELRKEVADRFADIPLRREEVAGLRRRSKTARCGPERKCRQ